MHLGLFVCMSVRVRNPKTIALSDLIFIHNIFIPMSSSKMIRIWTQEFI